MLTGRPHLAWEIWEGFPEEGAFKLIPRKQDSGKEWERTCRRPTVGVSDILLDTQVEMLSLRLGIQVLGKQSGLEIHRVISNKQVAAETLKIGKIIPKEGKMRAEDGPWGTLFMGYSEEEEPAKSKVSQGITTCGSLGGENFQKQVANSSI